MITEDREFKEMVRESDVAHLDSRENEHVEKEFSCPFCSETRMDYLVWRHDDSLKCTACGTVYRI